VLLLSLSATSDSDFWCRGGFVLLSAFSSSSFVLYQEMGEIGEGKG